MSLLSVQVCAEEFGAALKAVASSTIKDPAVPELGEVYMSIQNDVCTLTGTNLTQWIKVNVKAYGDSFSVIFSDTEKILKACKYIKGDLKISFNAEIDNALLFSTESLGLETGIIKADFPSMPIFDERESHSVNAKELDQIVKRISYAANTKALRISCQGISFCHDTVFCVDGFRAAASQVNGLQVKIPVSLPLSAVSKLSLFEDGMVTLSIGAYYAAFSNEKVRIMTRLLEDMPIDLKGAVPTAFKENYLLETRPTIESARYLRDVAGKQACIADFLGGVLCMGDMRSKCQAKLNTDKKPTIDFGIDVKYLLDAVTQFKEYDTVQVQVEGKSSPIIINAGFDEFALICPHRLRSDMAAA